MTAAPRRSWSSTPSPFGVDPTVTVTVIGVALMAPAIPTLDLVALALVALALVALALVALVHKLGGRRDGRNAHPVEPLTRALRRHGPRHR
ncbi:hypothetical protein [Streptomyces sp. NBC_00199]|uniref:hypothetical protein n=1 Tax=Streptomyces sp. NBC_00199 TaxID=2975678 RepID=UPI002255F937|nr:hypothetical protein [Streptomyces sp. NBC_00199]MCX5264853.1 hypothetical protein [Streptomyces sp. NBC_00199]